MQLLSALKNNEVDFNNLFNDKIMKIIETLLENNINFFLKDFSNFFNRLYTDLNATTANETRVAAKFQQSTFDETISNQNMFVTLDRPTNIIAAGTPRQPEVLPCLKPSAIINTIGTFDPVAQPEADFRCIWDRILDQTRNNKLYEHEYVTCLRIVMKGQAGIELDKMIKEYTGNLDQILEAIQDLFIPQHSIYDELVDLKSFSRKANEHMRTMVRRASLVVCKLRPTVAAAAWPDRRHTLLKQMIKFL